MRVIEPSASYVPQVMDKPYRLIEMAGRSCYKSEKAITDASAVEFVKKLVSNGHLAMLEHEWVHIVYTGGFADLCASWKYVAEYLRMKWTDLLRFVYVTYGDHTFISAPLRVFVEMDFKIHTLWDLPDAKLAEAMMRAVSLVYDEIMDKDKYAAGSSHSALFNIERQDKFTSELKGYLERCERPRREVITETMKHTVHTFKFVCDRGVSHELVRHRLCSFAQESTRYCNYAFGKFGKELTFIKPCFWKEDDAQYVQWERVMHYVEEMYIQLIHSGASAQEARSVLPNSLKTEIFVTANETEWAHIIDLRLKAVTGKSHPQMSQLMEMAYPVLHAESEGRV